MRIISPFRDYYDGVSQYGVDFDLLYLRQQDSKIIPFDWELHICRYSQLTSVRASVEIIGFCGKLYPVYRVWKEDHSPKVIYKYIYDLGELELFLVSTKEKFWVNFFSKKKKSFFSTKTITSYEDLKTFHLDVTTRNVEDLHTQHHCPIFILNSFGIKDRGRVNLYTNPQLSKYNFGRAVEPNMAYQSIRMWLSNQAAERKTIPTMSNEDNAARLGHGDKYSFRRPPSKK